MNDVYDVSFGHPDLATHAMCYPSATVEAASHYDAAVAVGGRMRRKEHEPHLSDGNCYCYHVPTKVVRRRDGEVRRYKFHWRRDTEMLIGEPDRVDPAARRRENWIYRGWLFGLPLALLIFCWYAVQMEKAM